MCEFASGVSFFLDYKGLLVPFKLYKTPMRYSKCVYTLEDNSNGRDNNRQSHSTKTKQTNSKTTETYITNIKNYCNKKRKNLINFIK